MQMRERQSTIITASPRTGKAGAGPWVHASSTGTYSRAVNWIRSATCYAPWSRPVSRSSTWKGCTALSPPARERQGRGTAAGPAVHLSYLALVHGGLCMQFERGDIGVYQILAANRDGGPARMPLTRRVLYV